MDIVEIGILLKSIFGFGPAAPVSDATPQALGVAGPGTSTAASRSDHVHDMPTAAQVNALGIPVDWNASTNTPTLTSSTAPTDDNAYVVTDAGSTNLDGISTWAIGDIAYFDGTVWKRIAQWSGVTSGTAMLKGDGAGGFANASSGVDYGVPITYQSGVPIGLPGNGTISSNGALTLGTATNTTYTGIYWYFPANAINSGSAAGFYWTVMSSTTAGTVYNNTYTAGSGAPTVPSSPTPFSGTTGIAYTQAVSTQFTLMSVSIPGGTFGNNGGATVGMQVRNNNSGGLKTTRMYLGAGFSTGIVANSTTPTTTSIVGFLACRGAPGQQVSATLATAGGSGNSVTLVDTTVTQPFYVTVSVAVATDQSILEYISLVVSSAP